MQQINLSLDKTTEIKCDSCENNVFIGGFLLRKASKFITGQPQDSLIPIQIMICSKCGSVNEDMIPLELRNQYTEFEELNSEELPANVRQMPIKNEG